MNCKKCGNALMPGDVACRICGEPVGMAQEGQPAVVTSQPAAPASPAPEAPSVIPKIITGPAEGQAPVPAVQPVPEPVAPAIPTNEAPAMPPQPEPVQQPNLNIVAPAPQNIVAENNQMPEANPQAIPNNINQGPAPMPAAEPPLPGEPAKKKDSPIVVALLIIALVAIVAFIIIYLTKPFDKKKNDTVEETPTVDQTPVANSYAGWMNYVLSQNITSVTLARTKDGETKPQTLSVDDLKNIFANFMNYPLTKVYANDTTTEEELAISDTLLVAYMKNNQACELKVENGHIGTSADAVDNDLITAIEESNYVTQNEELKDNAEATYNFVLQNYSSTIFDEYFISEKLPEETTEG